MRLTFLLCSVFLTTTSVLATPPQWLKDQSNSQWIILGGAPGIVESKGIAILDKTSEGNLKPTMRRGITGSKSVRPDGQPGLFYIVAEPWEKFSTWLGAENDVRLTLRYFDGAAGNMVISYDSSDPRVKIDPYPAGVWRKPDTIANGLPLTGDRTWKTLTVRLPLAFFTKRVHGGDVRIDVTAKDFVLAGVAFTRVPKEQEPPALVKQRLRVARTTGLVSFNAGARCSGRFVQDGDAPIVMEAELADTIAPQQGDGVAADPQASGGGFIHFVERATYQFTVTTPGRYVLWQRSYFPHKGDWCHFESLDGGEQYVVTEGPLGPENGWVWTKAHMYELKAGEHTFQLGFGNGARLDLLVFSHEDTPPDLTKLTSSYRGPTVGDIWTSPVKPFDVAQWRNVRFCVPDMVKAKYEYSADEGKTWMAFDPKTGLTKLPVTGGGHDSLQFHIKAHSRDGKSPFLFGGGVLTFQAGPKNSRIIENARLKIEIDPYGIKAIRDKNTGRVVSQAAQVHDALASLTLKKPGDAPTFVCDLYNATLEQCGISGTADTPVLTMAHRLDNGMRVTTTGRLLPNGQSEWQFEVENPTEFEVAEFRFPVVTGIKLGGDPSDDWLFVPKCWGQVMKNPAAEGKLWDSGASQSTPLRWTAMWDQKQGLYLGIEDPRYEDYGFIYGGDGSGGVTLAPWQRTLVKPRSRWKSGTYRLAVTGGDWHEAADIYRTYVARTLKPNDVHPYIKWLVDAWCVMPANDAPATGWDMIHSGGETLMAAWRQMLDGPDAGYCGMYPYPALPWGTISEFSQKLAVRRALGGMYTGYLNFQLWSASYGHYKRIGSFSKSRLPAGTPMPNDAWYARAARKNYSGSYSRNEKDYFAWSAMAMGSREWRDWLTDWTLRDLAFGTDGRYYDQFNMLYDNGRLYPDFDTYGCWMPATLDALTKIRRAARARNPYFTTSGEVCNDVYGQQLDLHMTSGVWNRLDFFRYCLPHQLTIDGGNNGGLYDQDRLRFIWQVGSRFDNVALDNAHAEMLNKHLLPLRRAVKSLLYDATFRDTVGVTVRNGAGKSLLSEYADVEIGKWQPVKFDGTVGRWFLVDHDGQRGAIVNIINAPVLKGAICAIRTNEFGPVTSALAVTSDGAWLPVSGKQDGDTFTFPVPEAECSSVILSGKLAPLVQWNVEPAAAPSVTRGLMLTLTNPNAEPLSGNAALRLPSSWKVPAVVKFGPIQSGQSQTFTMAVTVPENATNGRTDIWCDIATPAGNFSAYSLLVVNDPVVADFRGNPGSYHIWLKNLSTERFKGTLAISAQDHLEMSAATEFVLQPEAELNVPVDVKGQDKLHEIGEMSATVKIGRQRLHLVRGVMPTVPNGHFEIDGAGDRKPDWWMCRKVGDAWAYERLHLAEGAHSGKYCLQLDPPQTGEKFTRAFPVHGALRPEVRYRVSVWIKSTSATGVYANVAGQVLGAGQTGPQWKQFTKEFVQGNGPGVGVSLYNESSVAGFYDDLIIEESSPQNRPK